MSVITGILIAMAIAAVLMVMFGVAWLVGEVLYRVARLFGKGWE